MNKDFIEEIPANKPIVIADECGDSLWDAVLQQEAIACRVKSTSKDATVPLEGIEEMQVAKETKDQ